MAKDISGLENTLDVKFNNPELLKQALVHRSYLNEHPHFPLGHNERLEFLGDAVLELAVTEYLYRNFMNPEGELTNWRASLVRSNQLAKTAKKIGIEEYLYLSKGEAQDKTEKARQTIMANAMEAVIGAIYLDRGYDTSRKFIEVNILCDLENILQNHLYLDAKSRLQEVSQEKTGITPLYKVIEESGPDHKKLFKVGVWINDDLLAEGQGYSKQDAQIAAAENALKNKGW